MPHLPSTPTEDEERPTHKETISEREDKAGTPERQRLTPKKLSMLHSDVPVTQVFKQLFGREAEVDERTGELVYRPGQGEAAFPANNVPH